MAELSRPSTTAATANDALVTIQCHLLSLWHMPRTLDSHFSESQGACGLAWLCRPPPPNDQTVPLFPKQRPTTITHTKRLAPACPPGLKPSTRRSRTGRRPCVSLGCSYQCGPALRRDVELTRSAPLSARRPTTEQGHRLTLEPRKG